MARPRLADYDPSWPERFAAEAERVRGALGEVVVAIEHVGSTSVPGLAAKPTVDIAVGATTLDLPRAAVSRMEELGYELVHDEQRPWERRFRRGASMPWDVIVHVVRWGGANWSDHLRFRDALRGDREAAGEYEELKRSLLDEHGRWYSGRDKHELIARVLSGAPTRTFIATASAEETEAVAARVASRLQVGDVVTVSGELGSGKTTFVRGACRALGVTPAVTSPTFTIGHRYEGRMDVSHLDLYRFTDVSPAEWGDLEPYFENAVVFVEWPEAGARALPAAAVSVRLEHAGGDGRLLDLAASDGALLEGVA